MTPDDVAKFEQGLAMIAENMPPHWRRMFINLKNEGFKDEEAMRLLIAYICKDGNMKL